MDRIGVLLIMVILGTRLSGLLVKSILVLLKYWNERREDKHTKNIKHESR